MPAQQKAEDRTLPTTSWAILGLLTFGEMSGYDLSKLVSQSIGYFFTPAKSQIYAELRRLVARGYAEEREVEQRSRPDKRVYRMTEQGRAALRTWLDSAEVEPPETRSPFLVKVFFGSHVDGEALLAQAKNMRERVEERLREYREVERRIKPQPELFFPYLTLKSGLAHVRAEIRWLEELIHELERREEA